MTSGFGGFQIEYFFFFEDEHDNYYLSSIVVTSYFNMSRVGRLMAEINNNI